MAMQEESTSELAQDENTEEEEVISISPLKEAQSPQSKRRKIDKSPLKLNKSQLDEGSMCNVCFDNFSTGGSHRIVSLKCGHIFGASCIEKWVKNEKCCPQCKSRSTVKDFRNIYATKILVVDNTVEMELELKIQKLHAEKSELKAASEQNSMTIVLQRCKIKELETEVERLRKIALTSKSTVTTCVQQIKGGKMYLEKNIDFRENSESKLINFMCKSKKILISQKATGTSLFSGYGIRFIDAVQNKAEKFINTSSKVICDFSFDSTESYLVSASKENTSKIYHIDGRQGVTSFSPSESLIWSCAFNKSREYQVLFGTQNGVVSIYDTRMASNEALQRLEHGTDRTPVKFIVPMNKNTFFPHGGFFVVQVRGFYFYEYHNGVELAFTKLNFDSSIYTATYDEKTEMLLLTTAGLDQNYHILTRLIKVEGVPVLSEVYRIPTVQSNGIPKFTRPTQIKVPDGFIVATYMENHELQIHAPLAGKMHSIVMQNVISDICPIYTEHSSTAFAALAPTKCRIYKVNLDYC